MKEIAIKWLKQAMHEFEMAKKNIGIGGYDVASFLAHQSVEKLLKTIFILEGKEIPKIHYLDELAKKLSLPEKLINEIIELSADYTFARYPDVSEKTPYEEYDKEIAKEKVKIAEKVFDLLKEK